ncbi:hypothetical protein AB0305_09530 [Arthrobacter sp. NPDC080086]|uniref:hypothetical protein n=1 Tax=Arthrobacter sp. NPDC080086 TaxID=3155917 RepID=UPI00344CEE9B
MSDIPTAQERIAAAVQLRATLIEYFKREHWTPLEGCLIVSGIHPIPGDVAIPSGGGGLDNKPLNAASSRFSDARKMWDAWNEYRESWLEDGEDVLDRFTPMAFMEWVDDCQLKTDWLPVFHDLMGRRDGADKPDLIPSVIAEYANASVTSVDAIVDRIESVVSNGKPASQATSTARSPMPIPVNRDHLSTGEFANVLAVEPQSILKGYSKNGHYQGIRPTKLPNRRLLWSAEAVRRVLAGESPGLPEASIKKQS